MLPVPPGLGIRLHPTYSDLPILAGRAGTSYTELLGQVVEAAALRWGLWT